MCLRQIGFLGCGLDLSSSVQGPLAASCEHGNQFLVSMKGREIF